MRRAGSSRGPSVHAAPSLVFGHGRHACETRRGGSLGALSAGGLACPRPGGWTPEEPVASVQATNNSGLEENAGLVAGKLQTAPGRL